MINAFKDKSRVKKFAACIGKSSLIKNGQDFKTIYKIGFNLIDNGFGVIHGGYSGGAMQAINEGANRAIKKNRYNEYSNIGVPLQMLEKKWQRVQYGVFLKPATNLSQRIDSIILNADVIVVLPKGGYGTLLEAIYAFHLNQINDVNNNKIKPIIFYGNKWKTLMINMLKGLDVKDQSNGKKWCYFVNSLKDFNKILIKIGRT